jgi:hypothetical protein
MFPLSVLQVAADAIVRRPSDPWKASAVKGCICAWKGSVVSKMKLFGLIALLLQTVFFADAQTVRPPEEAGCGASNSLNFKVRTNYKEHPLGMIGPGKALIYVFQESFRIQGHVPLNGGGMVNSGSYDLTVRYGLDGGWIGGNRGDSGYFFSNVDAGNHQLCGEQQRHQARLLFGTLPPPAVSLVSFSAEAGKVYYFLTEAESSGQTLHIHIRPIDADEGKSKIPRSGFSTWE